MTTSIPSHLTIDSQSVAVPVGTVRNDRYEGKFTIVRCAYWAENNAVDTTEDLTELLPDGFSRVEGALYTFSGDAVYGMEELGGQFEPKSLTDKPMGRGWFYSARARPKSQQCDDDKCLVYISREDDWGLEDAHLDWHFPHLPVEIGEINESMFASSWDVLSTRAWMEANGFTHSQELQQMMDDEDFEDDEEE